MNVSGARAELAVRSADSGGALAARACPRRGQLKARPTLSAPAPTDSEAGVWPRRPMMIAMDL